MLDAGLREAGCPVRAFNFGVQGLTAAELIWLTGELAEIGGRRWKAVIVERTQLPLRTVRIHPQYRAAIGDRSLQQAWLSIQGMVTAERGRLFAVIGTGFVVAGYVYRQIGPGQIADLFKARPAQEPDGGYTIDLSRGGFVPLEQEVSPVLKGRADRMDWAKFATQLVELRTNPPRAEPLSPMRLDYMRAQIEAARRLAPEVVLALQPQASRHEVDDSASLMAAAAEGKLGDVVPINLGDPMAYPSFFADGLWFDSDHLFGDGPRRASRELGRRLCEEVPRAALEPRGSLYQLPST